VYPGGEEQNKDVKPGGKEIIEQTNLDLSIKENLDLFIKSSSSSMKPLVVSHNSLTAKASLMKTEAALKNNCR
jgi:hypothetical protein